LTVLPDGPEWARLLVAIVYVVTVTTMIAIMIRDERKRNQRRLDRARRDGVDG